MKSVNQNSVSRIISQKYEILRDRESMPSPVYWNSILQTSQAVKDIYGTVLNTEYNIFSGGRMNSIIIKSEWEKSGNYIAKRIISDKTYFKLISRKTKVAKKHTENLLKELKKIDYSEFRFSQLIKIIEKIKKVFEEYDAASVFAWFVAGDKIKERIASILRVNNEEFEVISLSKEKTLATQMEEEILVGVLGDKDLKKKAGQLAKKYFWMPFGYDGTTIWNKDYFLKKLKEYQKNSVLYDNKLKHSVAHEQNLLKRQKEIYSAHNFSKEQKRLIQIFRDITLWTDERKKLDFQLFYQYGAVLLELEKRYGISYKQLKYLFTHELIRVEAETDKMKKIADDRINSEFAIIAERGNMRVASEEELRLLKNSLSEKTLTKMLRGMVASMGKKKIYKARVKILLSPNDYFKIRRGEFIVATMTSPDYMQAMSKASGFITDEGGVTSHAAIIARETNKPCIIGTKIATKVLKDGDKVEVDVNKGVVKILINLK